jgi:FtsH-binding integral membrane protein
MDNFKESTQWSPRNRSGYWLNKAKSTKDGILASMFVMLIAGITLVVLHAAFFMNPDVSFLICAGVICFFAARTIIRDLFEWV